MYDRLEAMRQQLNRTPHLLRLGRLFSETVLLKVDDNEFYLTFDKGALTDIQPGPSRKTPWRFAITTDRAALDEFWQPRPKPAFHDIFGLVTIGRARIDGDILALVKNLRFYKEFLAIPREEVFA